MAEVRFEHDSYLLGDRVTIIYKDVHRLGYHIEVRNPDNERILRTPVIIGDGQYFFRLLPWAKEGTYVVKLFHQFIEVDSDIMSVGTIMKRVTFESIPTGAGLVVSKR